MNTAPLQPLFLLRPGIRLVLASASPRRRQFMDEWGLPYTIVRPTGVEPRPEHGETPAAYALRAATAKARAVAASADAGADDLILAADTVVALGHDILGKPADDADALDMLRRLSGREHEVISGVCCLFPDGSSAGFADTSAVRFHAWPEDVLRAYVRVGGRSQGCGGAVRHSPEGHHAARGRYGRAGRPVLLRSLLMWLLRSTTVPRHQTTHGRTTPALSLS